MIIGVISDTHDNLPMIRRGLGELERAGAEALLHCGDFIAPFAVKEIAAARIPNCFGVFGNNDGETLMLHRLFSEFGRLEKPPFFFDLGGIEIGMFHEPPPLDVALEMPRELIVFGHTHEACVKKGRALVVNPGECCGWLKGRGSVAVVDTSTMEARIIEFDSE